MCLQAWDSDLGNNAELRYKLISSEGKTSDDREIFSINEVNAQKFWKTNIYINKKVKNEKYSVYNSFLQCRSAVM